RLVAEGPDACLAGSEQLGLGRLYEAAGDLPRAEQAFALAAASDDAELAAEALMRLAVLLRRGGRYHDAAAAWTGLLTLCARDRSLQSFEQRAVEALAIHHEHRVRDLDTARRYAEALRVEASGRALSEAERRLGRLNRKMNVNSP